MQRRCNMIERLILVYAARAVSIVLIIVEATQAVRKIREVFEKPPKQ
jgi:hypothetical protein